MQNESVNRALAAPVECSKRRFIAMQHPFQEYLVAFVHRFRLDAFARLPL
jgi:hypothetical protein